MQVRTVLFICCLALVGCVSLPPQQLPSKKPSKPDRSVEPKPRKLIPKEASQDPRVETLPSPWPELYRAMFPPIKPLSKQQSRAVVEGLEEQPKKYGSIQLAVGLLYLLRQQEMGVQEGTKYIATDLYQGDSQRTDGGQVETNRETATKATLEQSLARYGIDIELALTRNQYLGNYEVFSSLLSLVDRGEEREGFRNIVTNLVAMESQKWTRLLGPAVPGVSEPMPLEFSVEVEQGSQSVPQDQRNLQQRDRLLLAAERLATEGDHRQAIRLIKQIESFEPYYPEAASKLKEYSNSAVRRLRQQAAIAFQSAIPVNDRDARVKYLKKAQKFLQQALDDYPESDQLDTVKRNLSIINADLQKLKSSQSSDAEEAQARQTL